MKNKGWQKRDTSDATIASRAGMALLCGATTLSMFVAERYDIISYSGRQKLPILLLSIVGTMLTVFNGQYVFIFLFRKLRDRSKSPSHPIKKAPGSNLLILVEYFYSPKIVEGVFKQIVADWRGEYFEALQQRRLWKARLVNIRYLFSFVMAMGLSKVLSFIRSIARR